MGDRGTLFRAATVADVTGMERCHVGDSAAGPTDPRIALYLKGEHHPQQALRPRIAFVGLEGEATVGYIGGHLTRRFECDGELQYLYVVRESRRRGVATDLARLLAAWFTDHGASRICANVGRSDLDAEAFLRRRGAIRLDGHWMVWEDIAVASWE
jgi:GNAT superfamily N-acetyltransferase